MATDDLQAGGGEPGPGELGGAPSAASIVAAAERLATEITHNAQAEANAIRARAGSDSDAARAAITERLQRLSALADGMLERFGEMRMELDALSASLDGSLDGATPATAPAAAVSEHAPPVPHSDDAPAPAGPPAAPAAGVDDAGARLIALNLALSDTPREEAARQLRGQVPDAERLVDEVYASVAR